MLRKLSSILTSIALGSLILPVACVSPDKHALPSHQPRFFIEAKAHEVRRGTATRIMLPISESEFYVKQVPVIPEFDIASVEIRNGASGEYLEFTLTPKGQRNLTRVTESYHGRRMLLVVGSNPIGAWRIDQILDRGSITTYVELDRGELRDIVHLINRSLHHVR